MLQESVHWRIVSIRFVDWFQIPSYTAYVLTKSKRYQVFPAIPRVFWWTRFEETDLSIIKCITFFKFFINIISIRSYQLHSIKFETIEACWIFKFRIFFWIVAIIEFGKIWCVFEKTSFSWLLPSSSESLPDEIFSQSAIFRDFFNWVDWFFIWIGWFFSWFYDWFFEIFFNWLRSVFMI